MVVVVVVVVVQVISLVLILQWQMEFNRAMAELLLPQQIKI